MSTTNSKQRGSGLTRQSKQYVRREVIQTAVRTGARAYQFAYDGDQKVQITGFPNGRATIQPVLENGVSVEPAKLLLAIGVPARWVGVGVAVLAVAAELARVLLV